MYCCHLLLSFIIYHYLSFIIYHYLQQIIITTHARGEGAAVLMTGGYPYIYNPSEKKRINTAIHQLYVDTYMAIRIWRYVNMSICRYVGIASPLRCLLTTSNVAVGTSIHRPICFYLGFMYSGPEPLDIRYTLLPQTISILYAYPTFTPLVGTSRLGPKRLLRRVLIFKRKTMIEYQM